MCPMLGISEGLFAPGLRDEMTAGMYAMTAYE